MRDNDKDIVIVPFSKLNEVESSIVGTKAFNIGKLYDIRLPVPQGFVITTHSLDHFIAANDLEDLVSSELSNLNPNDSVRMENSSKKIRSAILKGKMEKEAKKMFERAYASLSGFTDSYVAIRSSFPFEDLVGDPFSKHSSTYLNVKGKKDVIEKIQYCWASMYTPQNIFFLLSKGYDLSSLKVAVIIQKMIQAEVSGVMFTQNPVDEDDTKISIECVLGLGEPLARGELVPDNYIIEKETGEVLEKKIVPQDWMLVRKGKTKKGEDPNVKVNVSKVWRVKQKLENKYISKLVKLGKAIEKHFEQPMEIEWIYEGGRIWIVQSRPITKLRIEEDSWKKTPTFAQLKAKVGDKKEKRSQSDEEKLADTTGKEEGETETETETEKKVLMVGRGGNSGKVSGLVSIVNSTKDLRKSPEGSILVTDKVDPGFEGKLKNVVGIITDEVGRDSYSIILAKGMGIPCVVDTKISTKVLRNKEYVTLDGDTGEVIAGKTEEGLMTTEKILQSRNKSEADSVEAVVEEVETGPPEEEEEKIKTATKVFLDVVEPDDAPNLAGRYSDGVGFYSSERIIQNEKIHPQLILKKKKLSKKFIESMSLGLYRVARSFEPRPIIYQLSGLTSEEYFKLEGGGEFEPKGLNPKIGVRGASRMIQRPEEMELELEAVRIVRNKENVKNISVSIPFVRTYKELKEVKRKVSAFGFRRSSTFKMLFNIEVPSAVLSLEKLLDLGVDGVVVDIQKLFEMTLGFDVDNESLKGKYKEMHSSVMWSIERIIKLASKHKVMTVFRGDILSKREKMIDELVKFGATAVSIDASKASEIRKQIYEQENSLLRKKSKK